MTDLSKLIPEKSRCLYGPASVCTVLSLSPGQYRVLLVEVGAKFAMMIDGIGYIDADAFTAVASMCRQCREEIEGKLATVENN